MYNPHLSESPVSGSVTKGSTQLPFVLARAAEGPTSGSRGSAWIYACNWDCIWLKDNISFQVTFSVIDSSTWSLFVESAARVLQEPWRKNCRRFVEPIQSIPNIVFKCSTHCKTCSPVNGIDAILCS